MKIGIHDAKGSYSEGWIDYCKRNNIAYKIVNAYSSDIISDLRDCKIFMWHHNHANPKDVLFARELLISLEKAGKIVYPDISSTWHFDDKLGQKYLLEALELPLIPTFVFYTKNEALKWAEEYKFPAVFKLRGGAGSRNVKLVKNRKTAKKLIKRAFGRGIRQYDAAGGIKDKYYKYRKGLTNIAELLKAIAHIIYPIKLEASKGKEKGYVYFQEFVPDCKTDIRVQLVGDRSWAMIRKVRENDFRASGSGEIDFDHTKIPISAINFSLKAAQKLRMQSLAIDLIPYNNSYLITEISYAFGIDPEELEVGYWDGDLIWHAGQINPFSWMVEDVMKKYNEKQT